MRVFFLFLILVFPACIPCAAADLDHSTWDRLLKTHVTPESMVDYVALQAQAREDLNEYLLSLAPRWPTDMSEAARKAALINAYNAFAVRWIIRNYPLESIWKTEDPFLARRHGIDGEELSLDEIEGRLREMDDPRIHAAVVCAARSCPPLRREAYVAERVNEQLDDNTWRWLSDSKLNEFNPDSRVARVSAILQWYADDFGGEDGVRQFLARYAPPPVRKWISDPDVEIEYQTYDWGLNDASALGGDYSQLTFYLDWLRSGYALSVAKDWFLSLGRQYGVDPILFGTIYVGAIPFFTLSIAWLVRNLRSGRSPAAPILCASFFFISAYLYLLFAGRNIPLWVYFFIAAFVVFGIYSTVRKVKERLGEGSRT